MMQKEHNNKLKALIVYFSATGNTEKVAQTIYNSLLKENVDATLLKVQEAEGKDFYDYDLVFLGTPSIEFLPAQPVMKFIKEKIKLHRKRGDIKLCAPVIPGKTAVVFATYSGPHTGMNEVVTATMYMGQLFEHIGFKIAGEWHTVGEFHKNEDFSTKGKLGDIRGRPNEKDLSEIEEKVSGLIKSLSQ
jgi:flavodoxin